jgi:hypothetical protein
MHTFELRPGYDAMSLPAVDSQPTFFGSIASLGRDLFSEDDRYRLFARKVWPVLARTRAELEKCYCCDNGRPGIEPSSTFRHLCPSAHGDL